MAHYAATQGTIEGPASLTNTALEFKDMKISDSGPTSRVEDDPPEIAGSYVGRIYNDKVKVGMPLREISDSQSQISLIPTVPD